jgi:hypothetical protein
LVVQLTLQRFQAQLLLLERAALSVQALPLLFDGTAQVLHCTALCFEVAGSRRRLWHAIRVYPTRRRH